MTKDNNQVYLDKLEFVVERNRIFDLSNYADLDPSSWSRQEKSLLTQEYNRAVLANSTDELIRQKDYAEMARIIRPFAKEFSAKSGYKLSESGQWTRAQKSKLTRYFNKGVMLASKQFELYHSNDKESMRAMAKRANQKGFPGFNQVFYPAPPGSKIHYDKKTKTATATGFRKSTSDYYWEEFGITSDQLALDPENVVRKVIAQLDHRKYSIKAGEYSIGKGVPKLYTARTVVVAVSKLVDEYNKEDYDEEDSNSHYFGNWLHGIDGWDFDSPEDEVRYIRATRGESDERRRYKRALRKRIKYVAAQKLSAKAIRKRGGIRRNKKENLNNDSNR